MRIQDKVTLKTYNGKGGFVQGYGIDWPEDENKITLSLYKHNKSISVDLNKSFCRQLSESLLDRFK